MPYSQLKESLKLTPVVNLKLDYIANHKLKSATCNTKGVGCRYCGRPHAKGRDNCPAYAMVRIAKDVVRRIISK